MNFTMITPHHNHDNGYISLIIKDLAELPDTITVNGKTLTRKGEFHISLMALKNLVPLINESNISINEDDLVQFFLETQKDVPLSNYELTGELRYVKRDERETVVAMVNVLGVEVLFDKLRDKFSLEIPTQPTHITIYTLQPEAGIGILSPEELDRDSQTITLPELSQYLG
ncbi:MAG TPA: hypothetical protein PLT04_04255 [Candidatus Saccharibacteria bacterium]|nr:hypothetical protein [Candidatus Saccharibacteria bacterium]